MRSTRPSLRALVALAAVIGLLAAACSKSSTPSGGGGGSTAPATTPPATQTSPPAAGGTSLEQGTNNQFVFTPSDLTVKQGATITVSNVGSAAHTFTVSGQGIDIVNNPGQSQPVTIDLPPGTYPFICRFHVSAGMKGTLTVT